MRVQIDPPRIELVEGMPLQLSVTVTNTGDVIGGYRLRILGVDPSWAHLTSEEISLFPDTSQTVQIMATVPRGLGAGDRRIAVQVRELTPPEAIAVAEVDLVVPARFAVKMALSPMTVICGKTGRFSVMIENTGNVEMPVSPIGIDPEARMRFAFDPPVVALAPGENAVTELRTTARRRWFGAPVARPFALALPPEPPADLPPTAPAEPIEPLANGTMLQKPRLGRGALSLLSLLLAVSVFATVITIALAKLVGVSQADRNLAIQVAAARQSGTPTGTSAMGGTIKQLSDAQPAANVTVEVFTAAALGSPLTSTATDAKGNWQVAGLAAGSYKLRFRAPGFAEVWYPHALTATDATPVDLQVGQKAGGLSVALGGLPGTIAGQVVGDDVAGAVLTLSVPLSALPRGGAPTTPATVAVLTGAPVTSGNSPPASPATTTSAPATTAAAAGSGTPLSATPGATVMTAPIGSDGTFTLDQVPSPNVYQLTVSKTGFASSTQLIDLAGGETRNDVLLRLRTGDGSVSGVVYGSAGPLGGAVITATDGSTTVKTVSVTKGTPGFFALRSLVTPATYTLTVTATGYAAQSSTVTLSSGQQVSNLRFTLAPAFGSLSGKVTLLVDNTPAPGVTVTITGGTTSLTTVTQSAADAGSWQVSNLALPGVYTVTFSRSDLLSQTVAVSLDSTGQVVGGAAAGSGVDVAMASATAVVAGVVSQRSSTGAVSAVGEADITLSSGTQTYTVTSASLPSNQLGRYQISGVAPGTYTLSASRKGTSPTTVIITVSAGQIMTENPVMIPPASITGTVALRGSGTLLGLQVLLYQSAQYPAQVYQTTTTDANGHYSFGNVDAPQAYVVEVRSTTAGALGSTTVVLEASKEITLDLTVGTLAATPTTAATTATTPSAVAAPSATPTTPTTTGVTG